MSLKLYLYFKNTRTFVTFRRPQLSGIFTTVRAVSSAGRVRNGMGPISQEVVDSFD